MYLPGILKQSYCIISLKHNYKQRQNKVQNVHSCSTSDNISQNIRKYDKKIYLWARKALFSKTEFAMASWIAWGKILVFLSLTSARLE